MRWAPRLVYAAILLLAALPPLLSSRLARPAPAKPAHDERAGLTLGTRRDRQVVVTSVRGGGAADRGGLAVGDTLHAVAGRRITGAAMARRLIDDPRRCVMQVDFHRGSTARVARLRRCTASGQAEGRGDGPQDTAR